MPAVTRRTPLLRTEPALRAGYPGEWYIDRAKGLLYWYPSVEASYDNRVALTRFDAPYMAELDSCSHVILRGLTFEESRGSGVLITGGESCLLDGVRISGMGRDGVNIKGGSNHGIRSCLLRQLGFSGIQIEGGDRRTLTPAGHFVENSVVETFSTFKRTYEPAVHATGCGIRIAHNRFEHSSSSAMRYEGNDILVEYNVIRDVVNESDDQAVSNPTSIRPTAASSSGTTTGAISAEVPSRRATGVRMDDMICGVEVYGNIFRTVRFLYFRRRANQRRQRECDRKQHFLPVSGSRKLHFDVDA